MNISFALNQIMIPEAPLIDFIHFAKKLNIDAIEIRNDVRKNFIKENNPLMVKEECEKNSIKILSINALQKFNIWNKDRENELISLCKYADKANINAIVLVPLNDGSVISQKEQIKLLEESLVNVIKILDDYNVIGLVEPLGFIQSSLRYKSLLFNALKDIGSDKLKIVHDTFHHNLAGENKFFPFLTGLVHISGVSNIYKNVELNDDHRSIIDKNDILENLHQLQTLLKSGYDGYFSFEPFSETLIKEQNIFNITKKCFDYISSKN
tara:strand:- start:553 stop:1353 length:801 start_codon:yes stop_codon:yes gene_type:complete